MRIVRLANFVTPTSGGLRTSLRELGKGYRDAGHEPILVVPGQAWDDCMTEQGRVITVPGPRVPLLGGYRVLMGRNAVSEVLNRLNPDRLEVSDRTTLRWTGRWARRRGIATVMVSHESIAGVLRAIGLPVAAGRALGRRLNTATAAGFDRVVCTTRWAAQEFIDVGANNVVQVPLGVDLIRFHPQHADPRVRERYAHGARILLVCCTRLSAEKRPDRALATLAGLRRSGVDAALVMVGDGPLRRRLQHAAADLPVCFTGFLNDRHAVAGLLASADVVLAPGPVETFGLAALEALASGTPVVASESSALGEVIATAGTTAAGDDLSVAVRSVLADLQQLRAVARTRAEAFSWPSATQALLAVHASLAPRRARA